MNASPDRSKQLFAIRLSLTVGCVMLAGKWYAYGITASAAILSDAAESLEAHDASHANTLRH